MILFNKDSFNVQIIDDDSALLTVVIPSGLIPVVVSFLDSASHAARLYNTQIRVSRASDNARLKRISDKVCHYVS